MKCNHQPKLSKCGPEHSFVSRSCIADRACSNPPAQLTIWIIQSNIDCISADRTIRSRAGRIIRGNVIATKQAGDTSCKCRVSRAIDTVRAYTSGPRLVVEVDVVMDPDESLMATHDVAEELQMKLESLPNVERAYVHVDYETTHKPEHFLKKEL